MTNLVIRPLPAQITVVPMAERRGLPSGSERAFAPGGVYVESCWVGQVGPTAFLAWQRLARPLLALARPYTVDVADLAVTLGVSGNTRAGALNKSVGRLCSAEIARWDDDATLAVAPVLWPLSPRRLARASRSARLVHEHYMEAGRAHAVAR